MYIFLLIQGVFKWAHLSDQFELERLPQHSSDVFFHGESISGRSTNVWILYLSNYMPFNSEIFSKNVENIWKSLVFISFHWFSLISISFHWFSLICIDSHWFLLILIDFYVFSSIEWSLITNIECPNTAKSIENRFSTKKYIGAVVRKSSKLELVTEICLCWLAKNYTQNTVKT